MPTSHMVSGFEKGEANQAIIENKYQRKTPVAKVS